MVLRQNLSQDASLIIAGEEYPLDNTPGSDPPHVVRAINLQPGDDDVEWERRIENDAMGWGESRSNRGGAYDYASVANLHKRRSFLPGAAYTSRIGALNAPGGAVSFCEYWDGTDANRRLILIGPRVIYEVAPAGTIVEVDITSLVPNGAKATWGVRYKAPTAMASPKVFVFVQKGGANDYFLTRTGAATYIENTGSLRGVAGGIAKDSVGEDVLARVNENGRLVYTTEDTDPDASASWAAASYAIGETSVQVNSLFQQGRSMLVGRVDGVYTFDNVTNAVPITRGLEQTPDEDNCRYFKDVNGLAVCPTVAGLIYIDGLDWGVCGPVSSNRDARNLRGREVAVTGMVGEFVYCAVYHGSTSYIFMGTPRVEEGTGQGPFVWHGPFASVGYQVTDMIVSTVVTGTKRLWLAGATDFGSIELNDDFSPKADKASGDIFLPEGIFDLGGPGVIKDFRKAEFVAPASVPFGAANQWTIAIETTPGSGTFVDINGGVTDAADGVVAQRYWTTETSGKRLRAKIRYEDNAGAGELESVIVRGTMRPETADEHEFRLLWRDGQRAPSGKQMWKTAESAYEALRALVDSGRQTVITYGQDTFSGRVVDVQEVLVRNGRKPAPRRAIKVVIRRVKLA